ncbi:MAG: multicopper oxidase domain-containing protein, partial [Chloroflexota bacterium]
DVQGWLDSSNRNRGWVLKSDNETTNKTARLFSSKEGTTPPSLSITNSYVPLPIPNVIPGTMGVDGWRIYNITLMTGTTEFTAGVNTVTSGYNGSYLGPVLILTRTEKITINVTNSLTEESTTHWHGLHVPGNMDGGPHQTIPAGTTWNAYFTVDNRAGTNWYHPHKKGLTGRHVYAGLAGLLYVNDTESDALAIPKTYGVDDVPLIIQDREFAVDGSFEYATAANEGLGDTFLINGAINPTFVAPAQMVRFRMLNGSNHRIYNFGFSDNRTFQQIASDNGFLTAGVPLTRVVLSPGERAEIVVDFSGDAMGTALQMMSYNSEVSYSNRDTYDNTDFSLFNIFVGAATSSPVTTLPGTLTTITRFTADQAINQASPRFFDMDSVSTINGVSMDINRIDQVVRLNDIEIWEVKNSHGTAHPFHIHDDSFQILSRSTGDVPANEMGWKDTVLVGAGETVLLIKHFEDFADADSPYMFHCHILEHEDAGMMGQFIVVDDFLQPINSQSNIAGQVVTYTHVITNPSTANSDTFTITVASSQNWTVTIDPPSPITIAAGQTQILTISVTIPASETVGTIDTTVITANSTNIELMYQTISDTTTVIVDTYLPTIQKDS